MKLIRQTQDTEKVTSILDLGKKQVHSGRTQSSAHWGCWPACPCLCRGERQVLFSLLIHFLSHSSCAIAIENCNRVWEALGFWVLPPDWTGECCCWGIMCEYHLLRGAGSLRGFCWRGTFSQDSRQGEHSCLPSFLPQLTVLTGFPFCFPVELFLRFAWGLSCVSCGFGGCFSFIFFFFPVWDFFWGSACTPSREINQGVLQLFIAARELTWNVWVALRNYFQKFDLLVKR